MASGNLHSFFKRKTPETSENADLSSDENSSSSRPSTSKDSRPTTSGTSTTLTSISSNVSGSSRTGTSGGSMGVSEPDRTKKKVDKFQTKWLKLWPWLRFVDGEMFCATCQKARSLNFSIFWQFLESPLKISETSWFMIL